jgi:hypothetical protein
MSVIAASTPNSPSSPHRIDSYQTPTRRREGRNLPDDEMDSPAFFGPPTSPFSSSESSVCSSKRGRSATTITGNKRICIRQEKQIADIYNRMIPDQEAFDLARLNRPFDPSDVSPNSTPVRTPRINLLNTEAPLLAGRIPTSILPATGRAGRRLDILFAGLTRA